MTTLETPSRVHATLVTDRRELAPGVVLLGLDAPELAASTLPGQFVMAVPPSGEAAATALGVYEAEARRASLLFFVTGKRTRELSELHVGERLDLVGPLGNGFDLQSSPRRVAIVAGGVGIASVLLPAQALIRAGSRVTLLYGARTSSLLVEAERFADAGCEVALATDDGTAGYHGYVTDLLERSHNHDLILACGPSPMLRAVARVAAQIGVRAQLSLEETFACGVGGCWGCVVPIARTSAQAPSFPPEPAGGSDAVNARICKEGPVFWSDELRW
ncbi:MAG TPA: dihydroorotate dehydrogenase electron transfer subunit [Candidatus Baltobacteraceae bacterium]|nr:dihydroorotate dehydrogenase electron transfer subunit [Candidatus Baltobacteraceae bacterium]